jgi:hypothetical protein
MLLAAADRALRAGAKAQAQTPALPFAARWRAAAGNEGKTWKLKADVAGARARQKTNRRGDLLAATETAEQRAAHAVRLRQGHVWIALGVDQAGRHTVGGDVVAGKLVRQRPREATSP